MRVEGGGGVESKKGGGSELNFFFKELASLSFPLSSSPLLPRKKQENSPRGSRRPWACARTARTGAASPAGSSSPAGSRAPTPRTAFPRRRRAPSPPRPRPVARGTPRRPRSPSGAGPRRGRARPPAGREGGGGEREREKERERERDKEAVRVSVFCLDSEREGQGKGKARKKKERPREGSRSIRTHPRLRVRQGPRRQEHQRDLGQADGRGAVFFSFRARGGRRGGRGRGGRAARRRPRLADPRRGAPAVAIGPVPAPQDPLGGVGAAVSPARVLGGGSLSDVDAGELAVVFFFCGGGEGGRWREKAEWPARASDRGGGENK